MSAGHGGLGPARTIRVQADSGDSGRIQLPKRGVDPNPGQESGEGGNADADASAGSAEDTDADTGNSVNTDAGLTGGPDDDVAEADPQDEAELLERLRNAKPPEESETAEESGTAEGEDGGEGANTAIVVRQLVALWSRSGSSSMDLLLRRGREAIEAGDLEAAIEHLTALTDHAPDFAEGWYARATAHLLSQRYGRALSDLERAITLNPVQYQAIATLGAVLERLGERELAIEAYERAAEIHPTEESIQKALERLGGDEI